MGHQDTLAGPLNFLLLVPDEAWRGTVMRRAGRSTPVALALSPEDAVEQIQRASDPFSHVLVQPAAAGSWMRAIAGAAAGNRGRTALLLLGEDTADSLRVSAIRVPTPGALAGAIAGGEATAQALSPADILAAFDTGRLDCHFQPIVRLTDGLPVGVEALARLQHPLHGTLTPDTFIPHVEAAGLSMRLTDMVLRSALGGVDPGLLARKAMFLTVNLPLDVLLQPDALTLIETHRRAQRLGVEHIVIELTESRPVLDVPLLHAVLVRWQAAGYRMAIDDMGPEMVNQAGLFDLPFDMVKLDKTIVLQGRGNPLARRYLQRTIARVQARSLQVIAEGIEDDRLWVQMRELGVDYGQGFLIARAMPGAALAGWLQSWDARLRQPG